MPYQDNTYRAGDFTAVARIQRGRPFSDVRSITFIANRNDEMMIAAVSVDVGDVIEYQEPVTGIFTLLYIQEVDRTLIGNRQFACTWGLAPAFLDNDFLRWDLGRWGADKWAY